MGQAHDFPSYYYLIESVKLINISISNFFSERTCDEGKLSHKGDNSKQLSYLKKNVVKLRELSRQFLLSL